MDMVNSFVGTDHQLFIIDLLKFRGMHKILAVIILSITFSCNVKSDKKCLGSFEVTPSSDTINVIDCKGLKQGHWIMSKPTVTNDVHSNNVHTEMVKIEDGFYKDSKKEGLWQFFNADVSIKESIEYKDDSPVKK